MPQKSRDMLWGAKRIYVIGAVVLAGIVLWLTCCQVTNQPVFVDTQEVETVSGPHFAGEPEARPSAGVVETMPASKDSNIVSRACGLIYQGRFDAAGELIEKIPLQYNSNLDRLVQIVREYRSIEQRRRSDREAGYVERLAELSKLQAGADSNDAGDVNDLSKAFSVIARAVEFADEQQKAALLSESFVKKVFEQARAKAAEFESKGEWLDAYITCYYWLQAIDPENKDYLDRAEELVAKANILASLQDSPCETRQERYEKVRKEMFVRAIDALHFNYVSEVDYRQMAAAALMRCQLLAEVMVAPSFEGLEEGEDTLGKSTDKTGIFVGEDSEGPSEGNREGPGVGEYSFSRPNSGELAAWSAAVQAILDEVNQSPTRISKDEFIRVFEKVLVLNPATVELPPPVLVAHFAEAALSALDPYTVIVWPRQVQDFEKIMTNEFTGIGIEISKQKGLLTVASLLPDTPAYNSGLDAGDVIEGVDGVETKDMSLSCAVRKITGPAGTKVALTVRRRSEEKTRLITITRDKITVPTIRGWQRTEAGKWRYMIDDADKIGYVRITSFSGSTASDLEGALERIEKQGLRGLILDLRFNSGGLLDSAAEVSDKFIEEGLIVSTRPRWQTPTYISARKEQTRPNYPIVVLINRYSASASEIVSGVLSDKAHERAILVGERSHGKGSVQGITHYPGAGAQLKYTMAYYHLPSGQRVETQDAMKKQGRTDWGVGPNIEIRLRNDELIKLSDVQKDNDVLVKADHDQGAAPFKKYTAKETLAADPQLAVGVLVVKAKLAEESERLQAQKVSL